MNIITISPIGILLKEKHPIDPFVTAGAFWQVDITNNIHSTEIKDWYQQDIIITYVRMNGKNMCGVTVNNSFAMNLKGDKIIPTSDDDFSIYADLSQIALSQTRLIFHQEFKGTEFEKDFLPFERKNELLLKVKNAVYATVN